MSDRAWEAPRPARRLAWAGVFALAVVSTVSIAARCAPQSARAPAVGWDEQRARMVEHQLRARDITDRRVLEAMGTVPRHLFVPAAVRAHAYEDRPLPIGHDQTISQPYIVAYMTQALAARPDARVLEIGTGSGYQAAVLADLVKEVYTVEIVPPLAERAREALKQLGYTNVRVKTGDGYEGWPEHAPFDGIVVTAAPPEIPQALLEQLALGARMVVPVGEWQQRMTIITRTPTGFDTEETIPVLFVPMIKKG